MFLWKCGILSRYMCIKHQTVSFWLITQHSLQTGFLSILKYNKLVINLDTNLLCFICYTWKWFNFKYFADISKIIDFKLERKMLYQYIIFTQHGKGLFWLWRTVRHFATDFSKVHILFQMHFRQTISMEHQNATIFIQIYVHLLFSRKHGKLFRNGENVDIFKLLLQPFGEWKKN